MQKVLIIGSNGAGKSTFSFRLAEKTGLPLVHLDQLYWRGCWEKAPRAEFERAVEAAAQGEKWIIEGNNVRSLPQRLRHADAVIWFEFPPLRCVWNVVRREWRYRGTARPDMPPSCISRLEWSFLKLVWGFNRKHRSRIEQCLRDAPQVRVFRIHRYREAEALLQSWGKELL